MKKIIMLNCLRANQVCTGAACLKAFNERTRTFAQYGEEELFLQAFFRCNGCDEQGNGIWDEGMDEKLERMEGLHADAVHRACVPNARTAPAVPVIQLHRRPSAPAGRTADRRNHTDIPI